MERSIVGMAEATISRRNLMKWMAGAAAAAAAGLVVKGASATSGPAYLRTTTALNLRAQASTSAKVLLVMPAKALVVNLGQFSNGFTKVTYQGSTGWASSAYLEEADSGSVTWIGEAETTTSVNFRTGPGTGYGVLRVLQRGAAVEISDWVDNGYRYVRVGGDVGWIFDDYLNPSEEAGPITFKTTTAVNLRANPSSSARIIEVVPKGTRVVDYDLVMANGYRGVDVNDSGTVGWIYDAYLQRV